jgi:hypothetical protein
VPQGVSVHVGLNSVDPGHYAGWSGNLRACESDAHDMAAIAQKRGLTPKTILTKGATAAAVTAAIRDAASKLARGDLFFMTYSGHGGQVPDRNGDEADRMDETWALYDRQLVDDELWALWSTFQPGVRILVFSDSCHSGTVDRDIFDVATPHVVEKLMDDTTDALTKDVPQDVAKKTYNDSSGIYDDVQKANPQGKKVNVGASVILVSGCQDNQLSLDGKKNGLFTQQVLKVWSSGQFSGSHPAFHRAVRALMPPTQTPNYSAIGAKNDAFEQQTPLTV